MAEVTDLLFILAAVAGGGCLWLGVVSYRRDEGPGSKAFGIFLVLWGAVPTVMLTAGSLDEALYGVAQIFIWCLAALSWFLFTLQYTGLSTPDRPLMIAAMAAPSVVVIPWLWGPLANGGSTLLEAVASLVLTYYTALTLLGAVLLLRVARRYGHLSVRHGVTLAATGVVPAITNTVFGIVADNTGATLLSAGMFAGGFLICLLASGASLLGFEMFETTLAAGTVGKRAIARESDDVIIIVDDDERILELNAAATATLALEPPQPLGDPLPSVVDHDVETLEATETVELPTARGLRTFDPRVTTLTDQHGQRLGSMVSLRDITDRQIRRQRLEVLNRVMRHNLRNQVSVIKAHTEFVADEVDEEELGEHLETAADSADSLADLGRMAKRIEELLDGNRSPGEIHLPTLAGELHADLEDRWPTATITLGRVADATVVGDRRAVEFIVGTLVEGVLEQAAQDGPTVELSVTCDADDRYPLGIAVAGEKVAIPEQEIEVIREGTETQLKHGSGVGLWAANWAVTDLGGELSFGETNPHGTVVRVRLPAESVGA